MTVRLYVLQRATAALMLPLIIGHIAVMFYATRNGLTAADILGRTSGSFAWASFYGLFVVAAAIHAGIGLRTISVEWLRLRPQLADVVLWGASVGLILLGARAVAAVVL